MTELRNQKTEKALLEKTLVEGYQMSHADVEEINQAFKHVDLEHWDDEY